MAGEITGPALRRRQVSQSGGVMFGVCIGCSVLVSGVAVAELADSNA
jgi:hypothetical protein